MHRRTFVRLITAAAAARDLLPGRDAATASHDSAATQTPPNAERLPVPAMRVQTRYAPAAVPGMPGPYPGRVVRVRAERSVDVATGVADDPTVREMLARGMRGLTGAASTDAAWRRFFEPSDIVGIKVNCGGFPHCVSAYEIVGEVVRQLMALGIDANRIYIYERFQNQMDEVDYARRLPNGVRSVAAERANRYTDNNGYDPDVYLEADLFGEEDTRSNMMRLVSRQLTKIINIPNMKDHGATGVTGCLKNIAYGSFSNVARTHQGGLSHTYSMVGALAAVEPLRSRTVLQIMDGLRAVWHGGPFARTTKYVFYPRQIWFGTDPVALDRLLLDVIEDKRREQGVISVWNRSRATLRDSVRERDADPNVNIIIREPGHIEYAASLGLGIHDRAKIQTQDITL